MAHILDLILNISIRTQLVTDLLYDIALTLREHVISDKLTCTISHL